MWASHLWVTGASSPYAAQSLWASDCVATSCRTPIDLLIARGDGAFQQDVRLVLQTEGDALILMTYRGIGHSSPETAARLAQGQHVASSDYYLRTCRPSKQRRPNTTG